MTRASARNGGIGISNPYQNTASTGSTANLQQSARPLAVPQQPAGPGLHEPEDERSGQQHHENRVRIVQVEGAAIGLADEWQDRQATADELRGALKRANPALRDDMLSLHCSQGELVEVRVCLDKDLALRRCGKRMRTGCPVSAPFTIPATN